MTHSLKTVAGVCGRLALAGGITAMLFTVAVLPAAAEETPAMRSVSIAGLDLTRPQDQAALVLRVRAASHSVCREEGARGLDGMEEQAACAELAFSQAMQQVWRVEARVSAARVVASNLR